MARPRKPPRHADPSPVPDRKQVRAALSRPDLPAASLRELLRRLKVDKRHRMTFKRLIRDMVEEGDLMRLGSTQYALPGAPGGAPRTVVTGRIQRHPDGFGFLIPDEGGSDYYVAPESLESIFHGDRVEARILRRRRPGRDQALIARVVEPARRRVMGVFHKSAEGDRVEAFERSYAAGILIGKGDAAAARDGEVVGVEMTQPPTPRHPARGRVVEVLGFADEPGMDIRTVARKYDLRETFPPQAEEEAARHGEAPRAAEIAHREDFRLLPIVTIDGETAMDFDDAVQVERLASGGYRLGVHIADVAHYVAEGSALDLEARRRGTSVYFPGTAIPMLPARLSSDLCSLRPGVDRLTLSVLLDLDARGETIQARFTESVIRSAERMTYTQVAGILEEKDPELLRRYASLVEGFELMGELCGVLNARRRRRGTIDFDLPEPEILLDVQGGTAGIVPLRRNIAHRLIEEFMLAANEAVAGYLFTRKAPSLYRVHERPDPRRIGELNELLSAFSVRLPEPYEALQPAHFEEVLDKLEGKPEFRFLSRAMLRSMRLARYSEEKGLHFGLGTSTYTHFTSPIRRYPDLVVHRILKAVLRGPLPEEQVQRLRETLPGIAASSSRSERVADEAEREVVEWKKLAYMAERIGEEFDGFIASVTPFGFFVELTDLFVEGLVHLSTLPRDRYHFVERRHILRGERTATVFRIGAPVRVRLDRVDQPQRRVDFSLVGEPVIERSRRPRKP